MTFRRILGRGESEDMSAIWCNIDSDAGQEQQSPTIDGTSKEVIFKALSKCPRLVDLLCSQTDVRTDECGGNDKRPDWRRRSCNATRSHI